MDVSVIMQPTFQQSLQSKSVKAPHIPFIRRLLQHQLCCRDGYAQCEVCITTDSTVQFLGEGLDMPVVVRVETIQKTVDLRSCRCCQVADVPVEVVDVRRGADRGIVPQIMEDILKVFGQFLEKVVHMPMGVQRPGFCRDVLKTAESPQLQFIDGVGFTCPSSCSDWCLMLKRGWVFGSPRWPTTVGCRGLWKGLLPGDLAP